MPTLIISNRFQEIYPYTAGKDNLLRQRGIFAKKEGYPDVKVINIFNNYFSCYDYDFLIGNVRFHAMMVFSKLTLNLLNGH
jgi:hypothetical protein